MGTLMIKQVVRQRIYFMIAERIRTGTRIIHLHRVENLVKVFP